MRWEHWKFVLSPLLGNFLNSDLEMRTAYKECARFYPHFICGLPPQILPSFQNNIVNVITYLESYHWSQKTKKSALRNKKAKNLQGVNLKQNFDTQIFFSIHSIFGREAGSHSVLHL